MNLAVTNYHREQQNRKYTPAFKGPLDGALTGTLRLLDTNEMANAVLIDLGAMVAPRTYIDTKNEIKMLVLKLFSGKSAVHLLIAFLPV